MVNMADDVSIENDASEAKPQGADFKMSLPDGHAVWFRDIDLGQRLMLQRSGDRMKKRVKDINDGPGSDGEKARARLAVYLQGSKRLWDAVESAMIFEEDIDIVMDAAVAKQIDDSWALKAFNRGEEASTVDDDVEPEVKPSRRANAKRTRIK